MPKADRQKVRYIMKRPVIISKEDKWYVAKDIDAQQIMLTTMEESL